MRRHYVAVVWVVLWASVAHAAPIEPGLDPDLEYKWEVGLSASFLTGDYETDEDTDLVYIPLTIKRFLSRGDVSLIIPYVDVESSGETIVIEGRPRGNQGRGRGRGRAAPTPTVTEESSASGLGDVLLKGRYYAVEQDGAIPFVDLMAKLKLPTADEDKGLGTGEADVGGGIEMAWDLPENFVLYADLYYTIIGEPSGVDLDNETAADIGVGYKAQSGILWSAFYEVRSSVDPDGDDAESLIFAANYRVTPAVRVFAALEKGVSDGAPDYGITGGGGYRF